MRHSETEWASVSSDLSPRTLFALRHPWISSGACALFPAGLFAASGLRLVLVGLIWLSFAVLGRAILGARERGLFRDEQRSEEQLSVEPPSNVRPMP